jgi:hypothetical protein
VHPEIEEVCTDARQANAVVPIIAASMATPQATQSSRNTPTPSAANLLDLRSEHTRGVRPVAPGKGGSDADNIDKGDCDSPLLVWMDLGIRPGSIYTEEPSPLHLASGGQGHTMRSNVEGAERLESALGVKRKMCVPDLQPTVVSAQGVTRTLSLGEPLSLDRDSHAPEESKVNRASLLAASRNHVFLKQQSMRSWLRDELSTLHTPPPAERSMSDSQQGKISNRADLDNLKYEAAVTTELRARMSVSATSMEAAERDDRESALALQPRLTDALPRCVRAQSCSKVGTVENIAQPMQELTTMWVLHAVSKACGRALSTAFSFHPDNPQPQSSLNPASIQPQSWQTL